MKVRKVSQKFLIYSLMALCSSYLAISFGTPQIRSLEEEGEFRLASLGQPLKSPRQKKKEEIDVRLNDPAMKSNWGISKTSSEAAWKTITRGSKDVVVAIIDTGIEVNHPDLRNNLWVNKGEIGTDSEGHDKATNKKDDDGNGYVDDIHGWNFAGNNNDLTDNHGHGSHIAGIVGAEGGNGIGISGVAPKVSLMILKYYDPKLTGTNNLSNTIKAIQYAVKNRAHIINYSGGGLEPSPEERKAIDLAQKSDILFVAAAGNEQSNSDVKAYYPADYPLDNIISVTAVKEGDLTLVDSSNYGSQSVDLAAPGKNIYSTLPGSTYGYMTGTSQATAFVTGVAALIKSKFPDFSAKRIAEHLMTTGDYDRNKLGGKTRHATYLNTYKALATMSANVSANGAVVSNINTQRTFGSVSSTALEDSNVTGDGLLGLSDFSHQLLELTEKSQPVK